MAAVMYALCMLTGAHLRPSVAGAYWRGRYRLLLWSGVGFVGLTLNNLVLLLDKIVFTLVDLTIWRTAIALVSLMIILYGLIWDAE